MFRPSDCDPRRRYSCVLGGKSKISTERRRERKVETGWRSVDSARFSGLDSLLPQIGEIRILSANKGRISGETQPRVRIQSSPPASLAFSLSRCRCGRKLHFAAQNARISHGQTSNVCLKPTAGLAICSYFSEAGSGSGVSQANLNHRFALTALRQSVLGVAFSLRGAEIWRVLSFPYWWCMLPVGPETKMEIPD